MNWGTFKRLVENQGVTDDTNISTMRFNPDLLYDTVEVQQDGDKASLVGGFIPFETDEEQKDRERKERWAEQDRLFKARQEGYKKRLATWKYAFDRALEQIKSKVRIDIIAAPTYAGSYDYYVAAGNEPGKETRKLFLFSVDREKGTKYADILAVHEVYELNQVY